MAMAAIPITALYAALHGLMLVGLSRLVGHHRLRAQVSQLDGG